ncbi:histidinol dehydrogenase, partial [Listeria innocua]|uniref:histidinol dehydrogenase n=1 Tax=Listeria innocua TaxID=1642 RepID=UPI0016280E15
VEPAFLDALQQAKTNIESFHSKQKQHAFLDNEKDGVIRGQLIRPLETVGVYVPGGTAAYPSSVLMNVLPAKIAGVKRIVMITPPGDNGINPYVLEAAVLAGVDEIYQVGGAHGIAALAYGTESIPKVDKIVGPGNIYVATAKREVFGSVDIDMIAGPSEIVVLADETANPAFIAADLLSQAEHDILSRAILITT